MNFSNQICLTYRNKVWQRNYYDNIVLGENDYNKIWEYIDTNI